MGVQLSEGGMGSRSILVADDTGPLYLAAAGDTGGLSLAEEAFGAAFATHGAEVGSKSDGTFVFTFKKASVEIYDPALDQWTELAPLPESRTNHTATLLHDGLVLVVGGGQSNEIGVASGVDVRQDALLYDPATGASESVGPNLVPRHAHFAALLPTGRVLLVGGAGNESTIKPAQGAGNPQPFGNALASAEIFDPETRTFEPTGSLAQARYSFGAASLADGRVLVAGGASYEPAPVSHETAEVFDEAAGVFSPAGAYVGSDRLFPGASRLADGRVLVLGGKKSNVAFLDDLELFDPAGGAWQAAGDVPPVRTVPLVVPTTEGGALLIGGYSCSSSCASQKMVDVWHPNGTVTQGPELAFTRTLATATVLPDGSVLVAGGYGFDSQKFVELLSP